MVGIFTIIALLVIAPFHYWSVRARKFEQLSPVEQNLQRASHGFAVMVLSTIAPISIYGAKVVFGFFPTLLTNPGDAVWGLVFLVPFVYGGVRFVVGCRRYWTMRSGDLVLGLRSLLRAIVGFMGLKLFWCDVGKAMDRIGVWWGLALLAVLTVSWWMLLTGAVRFVLLTIGSHGAQHVIEEFLRKKNLPLRPVKRRNQ